MKFLIRQSTELSGLFILKNKDQWKFWISISILFKLVIFLLHVSQAEQSFLPGFIGYVSGDTPGYIEPSENFIITGNYTPDYRMPGYAIMIIPLQLIFSKPLAYNILLVVQLLISAISVYALALTASICFQSKKLFYIVFYFFALSSYTSLFDDYLLTESLCTSSLIFSIYFICKFFQAKNFTFLFYSGSFLTWVIFLRPVYSPLLIIFSVVLVINGLLEKLEVKLTIKAIFIFLLFFSVAETSWIVRNYAVHGKFIVLARTMYYPVTEDSYLIELMGFVKSWGGDRTWWNPSAEIRWFGVKDVSESIRSLEGKKISLPDYIYTSAFSIDSLTFIKSQVELINLPGISDSLRKTTTQLINNKLSTYTKSIKKEKPFLYYIKGPVILLKKFLFHSGTYNLFNKPFGLLSPLMLLIKIFYSGLYVITIVFAFCGILLALKKSHINPHLLLLISVPLYSMIFFAFIFRQVEYRYFVPAYPFMVVLASYFILELGRWLKLNKVNDQ